MVDEAAELAEGEPAVDTQTAQRLREPWVGNRPGHVLGSLLADRGGAPAARHGARHHHRSVSTGSICRTRALA
ncbi:hypothetical protein GCM10023170_010610 [Phytohabitans houttuyneae]|uniref:Uncharacterized protein n=1 Tax=Phytohabitans houttuyneae TaxID=1076126 RepID=A0A6V8KAG4_9ACTN|nr:hypothetical protein Phou_036310 [Phytohabitans houttuyneae]